MADPPGEQPQYLRGPQGYPQAPAAGMPSPRGRSEKRKWSWIVAGLALVFVLLFGGCFAIVAGLVNEVEENSGREITVTYQVEGTGPPVSITYLAGDLGMAQETATAVPWAKDVAIDGFGRIVSLTASNNADGGAVTCRILVGDRVLAQQTSTGPYASANCSGDAGGV